MKYKGLIFDFNGVLLLDSHLHEKAWKDFSKDFRGYELTDDEIFHHVHGKTNKSVLEYLLNKKITSEELNELSDKKESIYRKLCLNSPDDFKLASGAVDLFDFLIKNNIPHTIATASEKGNLDFFIKNLNLDNWFDISKIVYDDGSFVSKLEMFLKASDNLNLLPKECVVIEDSMSGIMAANKAGIGSIIGFGPREDHDKLLQLTGINCAISSLYEFQKNIF